MALSVGFADSIPIPSARWAYPLDKGSRPPQGGELMKGE